MKITIEANCEEMADLVLRLQDQPASKNPNTEEIVKDVFKEVTKKTTEPCADLAV